MTALIIFTAVLAIVSGIIEPLKINGRVEDGILADLDHKELTAIRATAWAIAAAVLIDMDIIIWWKAIAVIPACMAVFATAHRLVINRIRERKWWYLGVGSWYDRKWIGFTLWIGDDSEDLSLITSAQHYERLKAISFYSDAVKLAGKMAYYFEITVIAISAWLL